MATTQNVPQALSAEEVKAILKEARQHSTRDRCLSPYLPPRTAKPGSANAQAG
jgi:hypothetical protein